MGLLIGAVVGAALMSYVLWANERRDGNRRPGWYRRDLVVFTTIVGALVGGCAQVIS